jgi:hypothetical protein
MRVGSLTDFYTDLPDGQRATAEYLRDLILRTHPGISERLNWGVACFHLNMWMIYLNPLKSGAIDLCFFQGLHLTDEDGLLDSRDRKTIKSVVVIAPGAIREDALLALIYEAVEVNLQPTKSRVKE